MVQAKQGDTVKVHYTGKLDNGMIFDSSEKREPLEFKIGDGKLIPGFEKAIIGMKVDETKTIKLMAEEAYGKHKSELVAKAPKKDIPKNINPQIGQQLQINQPNGQMIIVTVIGITDDEVTLDANHPLAGKDLTFDLRLVEII
jgi:FKBP-type peptidyl-prolyl cis-trans isomerase 2